MKRYDRLEEQFEPALRKAAGRLTAAGYEETGKLADRLLSRINSDGRIPQPEEVLLFNEDILVATDGGGDLNTLMLITLFGTTGMPGILNALVACDPLPSLFYTTVEAALLQGRDLTVSCWLNAVQSVLQQPVFMNTKEVVVA